MPHVLLPAVSWRNYAKTRLPTATETDLYIVPFSRMDDETGYRLELKPTAAVFNRFLYRRCQSYTPQFRCFYIGGRSSEDRIACVYGRSLSPSHSTGRPLTLLYSHSNGMDIGYCIGYMAFLCRRLWAHILCWDYPGYGRSPGPCSEDRLYRAIERVYEFLTTKLKVPWQQIVAMGTSLGTAASIHLIATAGRPVKGVILQGGFMSAIRVLCPNRRKTSRWDQFVNIDKISGIRAPTLVVHGCEDGLFNIAHAESLHKNCPGAAKVKPLFLKEGLHVDFEDYLIYWRRLHTFLHTEVMPASATDDEPCCSYHPSELKRRGPATTKGSSVSLSPPRTATGTGITTTTTGTTKAKPKTEARKCAAPVVVCEHCLSMDKISMSTFAVDLQSGKAELQIDEATLKKGLSGKTSSDKGASAEKKQTSPEKSSIIKKDQKSDGKHSSSDKQRSSDKKGTSSKTRSSSSGKG